MINIHSETWNLVSAWAEEKIAYAVRDLKNTATDERQTNILRGRIEALEQLLALPQKQVAQKPTYTTGIGDF